MRIFLLGMMGSGKSTLGRQLAQQTGLPFLDLDTYIETRQERSISDIFAEQGQEQFRRLERESLEQVVQQYPEAIIATGGGAPCFFDNINFINRHGRSIWLQVPVKVLANRLLQQGQGQRPLVAGKTPRELEEYLSETLAARKQFYAQASYIVPLQRHTAAELRTLLNL